jgi:hypothetical protein
MCPELCPGDAKVTPQVGGMCPSAWSVRDPVAPPVELPTPCDSPADGREGESFQEAFQEAVHFCPGQLQGSGTVRILNQGNQIERPGSNL